MPVANNFVDLEFEELVDLLKTKLQAKDDWQAWSDGHYGTTANTLLEVFAHYTDLILYAVNQRNRESFFPTARLRTSMVALAQLIGYRPSAKSASKATVTVVLPSGARGTETLIPAGSRFESKAGISFVRRNAILIPAGTDSIQVQVEQGRKVITVASSTGGDFQEFAIPDAGIAEGSLIVRVVNSGTEVVWSELSSLFQPDDDDKKYYRLECPVNGIGLTVKFGDGKLVTDPETGEQVLSGWGAIPPTGAILQFDYLTTSGASGNITLPNQILTALTPATDPSDPSISISLEVSASTPAIGGQDEESVDSIRYNAPAVFRSNQRLVTREDWNYLVKKYDGVAYAYCWGEGDMTSAEIQQLDPEERSVVRVCLIDTNYQPFSQTIVSSEDPFDVGDTTMNAFRRYLDARKLLSDRYQIVPPTILNFRIRTTLFINRTTSSSIVKNAVEDLFDPATGYYQANQIDVWQNRVNLSDVVSAIEQVEGILYSHTEILGVETVDSPIVGLNPVVIPAETVAPGTIEVYETTGGVQTLVMAETATGSLAPDPAGAYANWTGVILSGSKQVNLTLPAGTVVGSIQVFYKTSKFQDIIGRKTVICRPHSVDVSVQYAD